MRLTESEALEYLNDPKLGFTIKARKYWEVRKEIDESRNERLEYIASKGFIDQHLERMAQLELVNEEMWRQYRAGNYKAADILRAIADVQYYLSNFYDSTQAVLERGLSKPKQKEPIPIPAE